MPLKQLVHILIFLLISWKATSQSTEYITELYDNNKYELAKERSLEYSKAILEDEDNLTDLFKIGTYYGDYKTVLLITWEKTKKDLELYGENSLEVLNDYYELAKYEIRLENFKTASKIVEKGIINSNRLGKDQAENKARFHTLKGKLYQLLDNNQAAENQFLFFEDNVDEATKINSVYYAENMMEEARLYIEKGRYTASEVLLLRAEHILKSHPESTENIAELQFLNIETLFALFNFEELEKAIENQDIYLSENFDSSHPFLVEQKMNKIRLDLLKKKKTNVNSVAWKEFESTIKDRISPNSFTLNKITKLHALLLIEEKRYTEAEKIIEARLSEFKAVYPQLKLTQAEIEFQLAYIDFIDNKIDLAIEQLHEIENIEIEYLSELSPLYIETLKLLSLCYWYQDNPNKSKKYFDLSLAEMYKDYQRTFAFLSEKEKEYYYERTKNYFNKFGYFSVEYSSKKSVLKDELYNLAIKTKGLLFQSTVEMKEKVLNSDSTLIKEYNQWLFLKEKIAKSEKFQNQTLVEYGINIDSIKNKADFLEKDLSLRIELLSQNVDSKEQYKNWYDIKKYLDKNEAAIEVMRIKAYDQNTKKLLEDSVLYAFVIVNGKSQSHPHLIVINNGKELESKYFYYYSNSIKLITTDKYSYQEFWNPISEYLKEEEIDKIYFSPDGIYHEINLNSLYNTASEQFLLDEITVQYVNNTWEINKKYMHKTYSEKDIALFGFPDFKASDESQKEHAKSNKDSDKEILSNNNLERTLGEEISYLPGTKDEVLHIDSLYKANEMASDTYLEDNASEYQLKALHSPTYLHVATHGFFEENNNRNILLNSGILLAGAQHSYSRETLKNELQSINQNNTYEDGVLTSLEAQNIDLSYTELVVLSACETGVGVVKDGEGVYGLKRSFQTAGAQSVILSLWKVNDTATKEFMNLFYDYLIESESKLDAFQHAQKTLKEKYQHPYYWGAFVLTGI